MKTAHEMLVETRNRAARNWCLGVERRLGSEKGCLMDHMMRAANGDPLFFIYTTDAGLVELGVDPEAIEARALCAALVGVPPHRLWAWNDLHTQEEVLALLDEAICESAPPPDLSFEFLVTA